MKKRLAWVLATREEKEFRDPTEAVRLAERAVELTGSKSPGILDTLGVTYAATGRFAEAVQTAKKAIDLAQSTGEENIVKQIRKHLEFFKAGKVYHEQQEP